LSCLAFAASVSWAQASPEAIAAIIREGKDRSQAFRTLRDISLKVGARVTGSVALDKGTKWAVDQFKRAGVDKVWLEQWSEIPETFDRGKRQSVKMIAPYEREMVFTTPCWTHGTRGPVRGEMVKMPATEAEFEQAKSSLQGKWVLMPRPMGMRGPDWRNRDKVDTLLDAAGIAGRVYGTNGELVWTHGPWTAWNDQTRPPTPMVIVRKPDFDLASVNVDKGRKPMLEVDIENKIVKKPMPVYNVVAEIRGSEKPDEVVIICGHFDSWNGPGSQGTCDNGTGSTATLESARIIAKSGFKPKRTIRFILWSGEEQGLLGSLAYVEKHKDELGKISAVLNEDSGQNPHAAILGLPEMMGMLKQAVGPMTTLFPEYPVEARQVERLPRGGSDHASFLMKGVPAFFMVKKNIKPYSFVWHTQNDRVDHVEEIWVKQMATNMSVIAFNLACADQLMPRVGLAATIYDPHAVGGVMPHEHVHCTCSLVPEMGIILSKTKF
jgi:hypothetical protein